MGKLLAVDYGTVRIGYAMSDEDQTMAFPRGALSSKPEKELFEMLRKVIFDEKVEKIIIGVPLGKENEPTPLSEKIKKWGGRLAQFCGVTTEYIDEFHSSDEALMKIPLKKDRKNKEKGLRDAIAAQIILERYISRI